MATVVLPGIAIMALRANFPLPYLLTIRALQGQQEPDPQQREEKIAPETCSTLSNIDFALILC